MSKNSKYRSGKNKYWQISSNIPNIVGNTNDQKILRQVRCSKPNSVKKLSKA